MAADYVPSKVVRGFSRLTTLIQALLLFLLFVQEISRFLSALYTKGKGSCIKAHNYEDWIPIQSFTQACAGDWHLEIVQQVKPI